jgi:hypothetical protein
MSRKTNLETVNESISITRYDNGWMVEISGKVNDDWKTHKIMCNTEEDVIAIIKEWNTIELDT